MKKILALIVLLNGAIFAKDIVLKVGASPVPHAQILEFIKPALKKEGIDLKVVTYSDYVIPNIALNDGSIDANFFQHIPYLKRQIKDRGFNLTSVGPIHLEPLAVYSKKIKNLADLKSKATIALPNDPSNLARALILLDKNGVIKLKDPSNLSAKQSDIISNPKKLKIRPLEAALVPKVLQDVDAGIVNGNYALQNHLSHPIAIESKDSPYANVLVVKKGREKDSAIQVLYHALRSDAVKKFVEDKYKGEVIPAF